MEATFDTLCAMFEVEAERQEALLSLCHAQHGAIRVHDIEYIEAKSLEIERLNRIGEQAEADRKAVLETVAKAYGLAGASVALEDLAKILPHAYGVRLEAAAARIAAAQGQLRLTVLVGVSSLQRALDSILQCMEAFQGSLALMPDPDESARIQAAPEPVKAEVGELAAE